METNTATYRLNERVEHLIPSKIVRQVFKINVMLPIRRADGSERFPVVYASDADDFFGAYADIANLLQLHGEIRRFILVGIGYENSRAAGLLRMRDFHTHEVRAYFQRETKEFAKSPLVAGIGDLASITQTTDANDFLEFIRTELMPFVEPKYPTIPGDTNYCGYSAGAGFGLHVLFNHPETFSRYILGSPTTSYRGHHFGNQLVDAFRRTERVMNAQVFVSVGELEEFKRGLMDFDLVSGYCLLVKNLLDNPIHGLNLVTRQFSGETHASAWAPAFSHGARSLLGSIEKPQFWPDYFK